MPRSGSGPRLTPDTYDPTGGLGFGPVAFNNFRQGGYVSLGYRPTELENKILRNVEFALPIRQPANSRSIPRAASTNPAGLWASTTGLTSYCVVKTAYEIDTKKVGEDQNSFILQVGYGL